MSNVAVRSRAGNLADLEAVSEVVDTQRLFLPALWVLARLHLLPADPVDSDPAEADFEVAAAASMEGEVVVVPGDVVVSRIAAVLVEAVEVWDTKEAEGFPEIVGRLVRMDFLSMRLLGREVLVVVDLEVLLEEDLVALVPQNEMVLDHLVGMIHVVVVAHLMTEMADIAVAALVATEIVTVHRAVEAAATWSR